LRDRRRAAARLSNLRSANLYHASHIANSGSFSWTAGQLANGQSITAQNDLTITIDGTNISNTIVVHIGNDNPPPP